MSAVFDLNLQLELGDWCALTGDVDFDDVIPIEATDHGCGKGEWCTGTGARKRAGVLERLPRPATSARSRSGPLSVNDWARKTRQDRQR